MPSSTIRPAEVSENRLLAALDERLFGELAPLLERMPLVVRDRLYDMNQPIDNVYFPIDGVVSMVTPIEGAPDAVVEVATVGSEGMVGLSLFLGADSTPGFAFTQVAGAALRMSGDDFVEATRAHAAFARLMHRYTQALFVQVSQSTACNRVHSIHERCARWLLMTDDRVQRDEFDLSAQFIGQMLGERRSSVNVVVSALQQAGFIRYRRGRMKIVDRVGLESAACGCYRVVRAEYDAMLGAARRMAEQAH